MSWKPVVVGVDPSPQGRLAAMAGAEFARATGARCTLVHAVPEAWAGAAGTLGMVEAGVLAGDLLRLARAEVERTLRSHVTPELLASLEVHPGPAAQILREAVAKSGAELVVLGAKRHGVVGRWLGGSTAKNAIRALGVSVWVTADPAPPSRVLVAVDLSETAGPTLAAAQRFAAVFGAKLRVLHVIEPFPYAAEGIAVLDLQELDRQAEETFHKSVWPLVTYGGAESVVRRGGAVVAIEEEAAAWPADLVVVGAHGRSRLERLLLGSVSEAVVNALPASVLVVRGPS